jgi:hypothetical protein
MTRVTGLCVAAAFGCAVTLGAQTSTTDRNKADSKTGHEVTVTGCLTKGADGNFMLTNARTGNSSTTGTTGTTAGTPTTSTAGAPASSMSNANAMTWKLEGGTDLDKHVGHKIEVTGHTDYTGTPSRNPGDTTASARPTTTDPANPNPNPTTTTAGTVGTSGTTADEQRYPRGSRETNQPKLEVTSIKMISSSCQ